MPDATAKAMAIALRRWWQREVVVPIERGLEYRIEREAREAARRIPPFKLPPSRPEGPGAA